MKNRYYDELRAELLEEEEEEIPEENLKPLSDANDRTLVVRTVKTVLLLLAALTVVEAIVIVLFIGGSVAEWKPLKTQLLIGLGIGALVGVGWFFTMKMQIDATLSGTDHPKAKLKIGAILRMLFVIGLIVLAYFTEWFHPATVIIGVLNLKLASFIAGLILNRKKKKTET